MVNNNQSSTDKTAHQANMLSSSHMNDVDSEVVRRDVRSGRQTILQIHVDRQEVWSFSLSLRRQVLLAIRQDKKVCVVLSTSAPACRIPCSWQTDGPFDHIWAMVWSGARGNITI